MKVSQAKKPTPKGHVTVVYTETIVIPLERFEEMWHEYIETDNPNATIKTDKDAVNAMVEMANAYGGNNGVKEFLWDYEWIGSGEWEADVMVGS